MVDPEPQSDDIDAWRRLRPVPGGRPGGSVAGSVATVVAVAADRMGDRLREEADRWVLWLPVLFGFGALVYLGLPVEPPIWVVVLLVGGALAAGGVGLRWTGLAPLVGVTFLLLPVALGLSAALIRVHVVAAPMLDRAVWPRPVSGRIVAIDKDKSGGRLRLEPVHIDRLDPGRTPAAVRLSVRRADWLRDLQIGDWVSLRAGLLPPPEPAMPGAFDFRRRAFFDGLGGLGYAVSRPERVRAFVADGPWEIFELATEQLRDDIADRLNAVLPGQIGALAAALVTGDRHGLSDRTRDAMRESGLAHLLAISGLHIGMVAGILFFVTRLALAGLPGAALWLPIKKLAAATAIAGAFGYLLLAGATVPTQRACLMTGIALLAIILDRSPLSLRLVAVAAGVILLLRPEAVADVSLQMSFAAVTALIAAYDGSRRQWRALRREGGIARRLILYAGSVAMTSVVACLATAPFALYHFNQVATYGVLANLVAIPMMAFWIMPCGLVALAAMPFGLDQPMLVMMGWGLNGLLALATAISDLPWSIYRAASFSGTALGLMVVGALWICLWRRRWRLAGLPIVGAGLLAAWATAVPEIVVSRDGDSVAYRDPSGVLYVVGARTGSYEVELWARRLGAIRVERWPTSTTGVTTAGTSGPRCDGIGCQVVHAGHQIAIARHPAALDSDCRRASLVIVTVAAATPCPAPERVIRRGDTSRYGAHAIRLTADGPIVDTERDPAACRRWTRHAATACQPPGRSRPRSAVPPSDQ